MTTPLSLNLIEVGERLASQDRPEPLASITGGLAHLLKTSTRTAQPAGQVGQEIYGAGAALIFATRAFRRIEDAPFQLYCDHFIRASERTDARTMTILLDGGETCTAELSFVRAKRRKLTRTHVASAGGDTIKPHRETADRVDYRVPANGRLILSRD